MDQTNSEKPQIFGWPHDEDGQPMRIIGKTWHISCKTDQSAKDSPWIGHEETIYEPVHMGARDEIEEDRADLNRDVMDRVLQELNEQLDEVHSRVRNQS
jgi:hypothetical protein